jgi:glycosyltransferase involved in cell wall biosynthesis
VPPLVSILLPARDAASTIEPCLRSILRQRLADWECIVVDDGSRDETVDVIARFAKRDERFRVMQLPPQGIVRALNAGLSVVEGELVARMDADDVMHRDRLLRQSEAMHADPALAAVGCQVRMFPRQGLAPGRRAYERWLNGLSSVEDVRRDAFVECPIAHPALMVRRRVLGSLGYREVEWPEDYDLLLRMLGQHLRIGIVARRLMAWRDRPQRLSRRDPRYAMDRFISCKAAFLAQGFLAAHGSFVLWGYGDTGKALARALASCEKRVSSIVEVHPGRIGQRIAGVPVVGIEAVRGLRGQPIVVSVAGAGPRTEIRAHLARCGFQELEDFVCAA